MALDHRDPRQRAVGEPPRLVGFVADGGDGFRRLAAFLVEPPHVVGGDAAFFEDFGTGRRIGGHHLQLAEPRQDQPLLAGDFFQPFGLLQRLQRVGFGLAQRVAAAVAVVGQRQQPLVDAAEFRLRGFFEAGLALLGVQRNAASSRVQRREIAFQRDFFIFQRRFLRLGGGQRLHVNGLEMRQPGVGGGHFLAQRLPGLTGRVGLLAECS